MSQDQGHASELSVNFPFSVICYTGSAAGQRHLRSRRASGSVADVIASEMNLCSTVKSHACSRLRYLIMVST